MNRLKEIIEDNTEVLLFFSVINPLFWVAVVLCAIVFVIAFVLYLLFRLLSIQEAWNYFVKIPRMNQKDLKRTLSFIEAVEPANIKQRFLKRIFIKKINSILND